MLYHDGGAYTVGSRLVRLVVLKRAEQHGNHECQHHCDDNEDRKEANRTSPAKPQRLPVIFFVVELQIPHQRVSIDEALAL